MMLNPDKRVVEALVHLEHDPRFQDVVAWLQESLQAQQESCMLERDTDELRRAQGAALTLKGIVSTARQARDLMRQMR